jgi:hypothetical protein
MSNGEGPPPIFEGEDFPYWKIHMEVYLEAIDVGCLRATTEGLSEIKDPANPVGDEEKYDRWNAKAKNALYRGLCKDIFDRVRNAKKMLMNYGKTFVLSMRELRVSVRNAIILL